jgi:hypothetical protein
MVKSKEIGISLQAIFSKATTTVDGGWVLSFAVSQDEAHTVTQITALREKLLQLAIIPLEGEF